MIARLDGSPVLTIPKATGPVWSPDGSRLAFVATGGGVYVYDLAAGETSPKLAEGSEPQWYFKLTEGSARAWSPDGTTLAFIRDGNLYLAVSGEERQLTQSPYGYIKEPRWSPDGQHLTFSYSPGVDSDVYVARADGTEERVLAPGWSAKWSPDSRRISFILGTGGLGFGGSIYTVDPDGQAPARVAGVHYSDDVPACVRDLSYAWSPDGSLIAFVSYDGSTPGRGGSFVVAADGSSAPVKIGDGFGSTWSADGTRLAFGAMQGPTSENCAIFLADPAGTEREPLTAGVSPSWSPDGIRVAFLREDGLYVVNADGSGERQVAAFENTSPAFVPTTAWSRDGKKLAFQRDHYESNIPVAETYVADLSSDQAPLALGEGANPVWLPDGEHVAVVVYEDYKPHVDIVSADGSGARQRFLEASQVDWSPDGSQIVFTR